MSKHARPEEPQPEHTDAERQAIERDRDLAWELYRAQPTHPKIPQLTQSVLVREPSFTGMIILLAKYHDASGDLDEARRLIQDLLARRDRQYVNALRELRDLEYHAQNYAETLRLAKEVLREDPEANWLDRMELGTALVYTGDDEAGWSEIDNAVEPCAKVDAGSYADALGQRATRFLSTGAHPDRFLPAAEEAVKADPSEPLLATTLAYAYMYNYRPHDALELLLRVLREDPTEEVAQGGVMVARAFVDPIESGDATMDMLRDAGMGEMAWRMLRDQMFEAGLKEALAALDYVLPEELAAVLRPPLSLEDARETGGEDKTLAWRDGQPQGTGHLWGTGEAFRLMTGAEVSTMEDAIEEHPTEWPQWDTENEYFTIIFTDDAGNFRFEGPGGRLIQRGAGGADQEIAPSFTDWVWDRVAAFGGTDARPGR